MTSCTVYTGRFSLPPYCLVRLWNTCIELSVYKFFSQIQGPFFATSIVFGWVMKHLYRVKCLQISSQIHGPFFTTPIVFGWVMKHLYRVKYLQVSYRIQGSIFATPIIFGWIMKHLYRVRFFYQEEFTPRIDRVLLPVSTRISRLGLTNSGSTPNFSFF